MSGRSKSKALLRLGLAMTGLAALNGPTPTPPQTLEAEQAAEEYAERIVGVRWPKTDFPAQPQCEDLKKLHPVRQHFLAGYRRGVAEERERIEARLSDALFGYFGNEATAKAEAKRMVIGGDPDGSKN